MQVPAAFEIESAQTGMKRSNPSAVRLHGWESEQCDVYEFMRRIYGGNRPCKRLVKRHAGTRTLRDESSHTGTNPSSPCGLRLTDGESEMLQRLAKGGTPAAATIVRILAPTMLKASQLPANAGYGSADVLVGR
jgi:hypothetical protein